MEAFERLIKYTAYATGSDSSCPDCPSCPEQLVFGKALAEEMNEIGLTDVTIDENGYVFGTLEANCDAECPTLGFISHLDVVRDVPFENIKTRIVEDYDGGDIVLNEEKNIVLKADNFPQMQRYKGDNLVVTDGTTLLGADDKAGIANIMTACERMINDPSIKHGKLRIGFTPDEEIGRGADKFDVAAFGADYAYTCDGGYINEVSYETFNAASLKVTVKGFNIHPGSAKNKMKNASLIAMEFNSLLPENEKPEHTEGYEGFYHMAFIKGSVEEATMMYILRDHDKTVLDHRKDVAQKAADYLNFKYGEGTVIVEAHDAYRNMREMILPNMFLIDLPFEALREMGIDPVSAPVRGGTDGCTLSFMGLPCPNLGTGGGNCHGVMEYASVKEMEQGVELIIRIAEKFTKVSKKA
ncbi:MAG: peptidase T [Eubacteriales bacterium]|nr:peptidase T [Eubacteriales bacterium]